MHRKKRLGKIVGRSRKMDGGGRGEEQACAGTWVFHVRTRARRSLKRSARERVEEVSCAVLRGATVSLSAIFIVINSHSLVYATPLYDISLGSSEEQQVLTSSNSTQTADPGYGTLSTKSCPRSKGIRTMSEAPLANQSRIRVSCPRSNSW